MMARSANRGFAFLGIACLVAAAGLAWLDRGFVYASPSDRFVVEELRLHTGPDTILRGQVFVPSPDGDDSKPPGVLFSHGVNNSKETMRPLAVAFARRGFVALAFDFGGHGESYDRPVQDDANAADVRLALESLASHRAVDSTRLAIVGHSMGVRASVPVAGAEPNVKAVVAIGMEVVTTPTSPANLLLIAGLYDQFFSPAVLKDAFRLTSGVPAPIHGELYGSFTAGTARRLFLSPSIDHLLEPFDATIIQESVDWVEQALAMPTFDRDRITTVLHPLSLFLQLLGCGLLLFALVVWLLCRQTGSPNEMFRRGVAFPGGFACLAPTLLDYSLNLPAYLAANATVVLLSVLLATNLVLRIERETGSPREVVVRTGGRKLASLIALAGVVWIGNIIVCRVPDILNQQALVNLPMLAAQISGFLPYHLYLKARTALCTEYSTATVLSSVAYAIVALEVMLPGEVLRWLAMMTGHLLGTLRFRGRLASLHQWPARQHWIRLAILLLALTFLAVLLGHKLAQMESGMAGMVLRLTLRMLVVPAALLVLVLNTTSLGTAWMPNR